ncbi:MAG: Gfo/Idh/MocA family oxidoreductase [Pseudomonadota bacterium]
MPDAPSPLRVAVSGAGFFSSFQLRAWRRLPGVALVGVCNRTRAKAEAAAREHGVEAAFDDLATMLDAAKPDLLDVVTPPETHGVTLALATARGVPVVCQKPFCASLAEARDVAAAADRVGVPVFVHENFRFQPWHEEIRRLVADGAIGEPYQAAFRIRPGDGQGPAAYQDRQPYFRDMERFLVRETAVHVVDLLRALLGEVVAVSARLRQLNPVIRGEDSGMILLEFADGPWGVIDGNRLVDHATDQPRRTLGEMLVEGSDGALRLDGAGRLFRRSRGQRSERHHVYCWEDREFAGDCVYRLQRALVSHLREGTPMPNQARAFLRNVEIEAAIYQAHTEGRRIAVDDHDH